MLISAIIAPVDAPQNFRPPPQPLVPRLDRLDHELVERVRSDGRYGTPIVTVLNSMAKAQGQDRAGQRQKWLELWSRMRELMKARVLHRFGRRHVTATEVHREQGVRRRRRNCAGSTLGETGQPCGTPTPNNLNANLFKRPSPVPTLPLETLKTQTAVTPEALSQAGRLLARLPRRPKLRRGWIGGKPSYLGMPIWVNGQVGFVFGSRRGKVIYTVEPGGPAGDPSSAGELWGVASAKDVQPVKNPAAAVLGQGKRGVRERQSDRKQSAARLNGCRPVLPGRRPRGRPRR